MKCFKCGAELTDDTKFCSYCGAKIEEINESVDLDDSKEYEEEVEVEKEEFKTYTSSFEPTKPTVTDKIKGKFLDFWSGLSTFGKVTTAGLVLFALLGVIAFLAGRIFAGIISVLQIAIIVVAILMKKGTIKTPKTWIPLVAIILSFVLVVPYFSLFGIRTSDFAKYDWNEIVLSDLVAKPTSAYGVIEHNSESGFEIEVKNISPKEFLAYIEDCKAKGFTVDAEKSERHFEAYNKDGYKLSIDYDESKKLMDISVEAEKEFGTLKWSDSEMAKLIPIPKSGVGEIISDSEDSFSVYVGETTLDDYNAYVAECEKNGFAVDTQKEEKHFYAKNSSAYALTVDYKGNNVIYINVDEPDFYVDIEVECVENLIFSKYDVDVYIDDWSEGTVEHGKTETFSTILSRGSHEFKFVSAEDDELTGEIKFDIYQDEQLKVKISCSSSGITVKIIKGPSPLNAENKTDYSLDYKDAQSFEEALNNGEKVNGKIVQFYVNDYKPDSALGINCWSGEHLNFISKNKLNVKQGDLVIGKVSVEPSKVFNSWEIHYEVLAINGTKVEGTEAETDEESDTPKIAMTIDSADYAGKKAIDVEQEMKTLGFTNIVQQQVKTTDTSKPDGQVTSIIASNDAFNKGDEFESDVEIIIYSWKVEKPSTSEIVLPVSGTKLAKDFDSKSERTAYYINVDGTSNKPSLTTWGNAKVTDGVAEYLNYLKSIGFTVTVVDTTNKTPYAGFNTYETNFKVSSADVTWTMYLMIQHEKFVEYELDIDLQ